MDAKNIPGIIAALPEKGNRRVEAILALGRVENNAGVLMELASSEKGKCKTAAQKALAQLDYKPAASLWKKLVSGKYMGEDVLMPSCSDCVSDAVAPVIHDFFSSLFALPRGTKMDAEQFDKFKFCVSLMLGKATSAMCEIYRLAAANNIWIGGMKQHAPTEKALTWILNENLRLWDATPGELQKIFPVTLTASIIKSLDRRLMALADELYETHGGAWLIPVFMKALLTDAPPKVYAAFAKLLSDNAAAICLCNALGMLVYSEQSQTHQALIFWGDEAYGLYDTRCSFSRPAALDEQWIWRLCEKPNETKPAVTFQTYNRGGVKYQDYDEMLLELLPREMADGKLKSALAKYFMICAKNDNGETSLYSDAASRLGTAH